MGCCAEEADEDSKHEVGVVVARFDAALLAREARGVPHRLRACAPAPPRCARAHVHMPQGMVVNRGCRDVIWLLLFIVFWVGMFIICGIAARDGEEFMCRRAVLAATLWPGLPAPGTCARCACTCSATQSLLCSTCCSGSHCYVQTVNASKHLVIEPWLLLTAPRVCRRQQPPAVWH